VRKVLHGRGGELRGFRKNLRGRHLGGVLAFEGGEAGGGRTWTIVTLPPFKKEVWRVWRAAGALLHWTVELTMQAEL
jgi:hypothetical protein